MNWKFCFGKIVFLKGVIALYILFFAMYQADANISISDRNALLISFQRLAILDGMAAVDIWATSGLADSWKRQAKKVLSNPLMSAAFLDPAITLVSGEDNGSKAVGGYFNPWVNGLLILQLQRTSKGPRITDIDLKMISGSMDLRGKGPDELARIISTRLMEAKKQLNTVAKSWDRSEQKNDKSDEWLELVDRLQPEIRTARSVLAPDGDPDKAHLRKAFDRVLDGLKGDGDITGLDLSGEEPKDWKETLLPVYVNEFKGLTVVVLASHRYPLSLLWIQMDENSSQPVKKWKILHMPMDY